MVESTSGYPPVKSWVPFLNGTAHIHQEPDIYTPVREVMMTNLELALVLEALSGLKYPNLRDSGEHPRSSL